MGVYIFWTQHCLDVQFFFKQSLFGIVDSFLDSKWFSGAYPFRCVSISINSKFTDLQIDLHIYRQTHSYMPSFNLLDSPISGIVRIVTSIVKIITMIITITRIVTRLVKKWSYPNRKSNYFSSVQATDQKSYFTKCFAFDSRD